MGDEPSPQRGGIRGRASAAAGSMGTTLALSGAARNAVPVWMAVVRVLFGVLLFVDAILEFQPGTYQVFNSLLYSNASVSPEPLRGALILAAQIVAHNPSAWNGALAGLEAALAICVLLGIWGRLALLLSLPLFLVIWVFGQGMGLPFAAGTTDLNSGIPYFLISVLLLSGHSWERASVWAWVQRPGTPRTPRFRIAVAGSLAAALVLGLLTWGSVSLYSRTPGQNGPPAVGGASLTFDPQADLDVLFGGCNAVTCSNSTWLWDGHRWVRASTAVSPPQLGYSGTGYDPHGNRVVLFGGAGAQGLGPAQSSTWTWDQGWTRLRPATSPAGRRFAAVGFDPVTGQLIMFGGDDATGRPLAGTWVLIRGTWVRLAPADSPSPRTASAMAWDPARRELILYGGSDGSQRLGDTWAWDGSNWSPIASSRAPGPIAYAPMSTDPLSGSVLLFTGLGHRYSTWELGAAGWVPQHTVASPPTYSFSAMAPDPAGRGVILFGGATSAGSGFSSQTWIWTAAGWNRLSGVS